MDNSDRVKVGRILAKGFSVLAADLWKFLAIACLIFSPLVMLQILLLRVDPATAATAETGLNLLTNLVFTPVTAAALVYGVFQRLQDRPSTIADCLRAGFQRGPAVFIASFMIGLITVFGLILLVVPGIVAASGLFVAIPALVVERNNVARSLERSWDLTRNHRLRMFGLLVMVFLASAATLVVMTVLWSAVGDLETASDMMFNLVGTLLLIPIYTYQAVLQGVAYHELRAAKEGLDVEDLAAVFE